MEDVRLDDEIECNFRTVFEDNGGGVDDEREIIYAKR